MIVYIWDIRKKIVVRPYIENALQPGIDVSVHGSGMKTYTKIEMPLSVMPISFWSVLLRTLYPLIKLNLIAG